MVGILHRFTYWGSYKIQNTKRKISIYEIFEEINWKISSFLLSDIKPRANEKYT